MYCGDCEQLNTWLHYSFVYERQLYIQLSYVKRFSQIRQIENVFESTSHYFSDDRHHKANCICVQSLATFSHTRSLLFLCLCVCLMS